MARMQEETEPALRVSVLRKAEWSGRTQSLRS
jgi:hypothetical protein